MPVYLINHFKCYRNNFSLDLHALFKLGPYLSIIEGLKYFYKKHEPIEG